MSNSERDPVRAALADDIEAYVELLCKRWPEADETQLALAHEQYERAVTALRDHLPGRLDCGVVADRNAVIEECAKIAEAAMENAISRGRAFDKRSRDHAKEVAREYTARGIAGNIRRLAASPQAQVAPPTAVEEIIETLTSALKSIAANSCCEGCQEAKLVARRAMAALHSAEGSRASSGTVGEPVAWQSRNKVPGCIWRNCDHPHSNPGFEYRPLYALPPTLNSGAARNDDLLYRVLAELMEAEAAYRSAVNIYGHSHRHHHTFIRADVNWQHAKNIAKHVLNNPNAEWTPLALPRAVDGGAVGEPVAWLDVRTANLGWQNRLVATNPQYVENNGPENFVALYAVPRSEC